MLSHDIRNPLNAIMGVVQLLDRGELSESQRRFVRLLKSSSENMLSLLNHVLELSKTSRPALPWWRCHSRSRPWWTKWSPPSSLPRARRDWRCERRWTEAVPSIVIGDPVAMRQILSNLVGNAVKFTSDGSVTLAVRTNEFGPMR